MLIKRQVPFLGICNTNATEFADYATKCNINCIYGLPLVFLYMLPGKGYRKRIYGVEPMNVFPSDDAAKACFSKVRKRIRHGSDSQLSLFPKCNEMLMQYNKPRNLSICL